MLDTVGVLARRLSSAECETCVCRVADRPLAHVRPERVDVRSTEGLRLPDLRQRLGPRMRILNHARVRVLTPETPRPFRKIEHLPLAVDLSYGYASSKFVDDGVRGFPRIPHPLQGCFSFRCPVHDSLLRSCVLFLVSYIQPSTVCPFGVMPISFSSNAILVSCAFLASDTSTASPHRTSFSQY